MAKMMYLDMSKCIGCRACQVACKQWNQLPAEDTSFTGTYQNPPDMSGASPTVVKFKEAFAGGQIQWNFFKDQCRHCKTTTTTQPPCLQNCPLGAIVATSSKAVRIDPAVCTPGVWPCTRQCQLACPYNVPKDSYVKNGITVYTASMMKCDMCYDRFGHTTLNGSGDPPTAQDGPRFVGGPGIRSNRPACELVCPTRAIRTANHKKVVQWARKRKRRLRRTGYPGANTYRGNGGRTWCVWVLPFPRSDYNFTV